MSQQSEVFYINAEEEREDISRIADKYRSVAFIDYDELFRDIYEIGYKRGYIYATKNAAAQLHELNEASAKITSGNMKD